MGRFGLVLGPGCVALGGAELDGDIPELARVVGVDDVGDFVTERVKGFLEPMIEVGLPAYHDFMVSGSVVATEGFAG